MAVVILACSVHFQSIAQLSEGGRPVSFTDKNIPEEFDFVQIQKPDIDKMRMEDAENEKNGTPRRISSVLPVKLNMDNSGVWTQLRDGGRLWRLKIKSEGALALGVYYNEFYLPPKSKLFLYNHDKQHVLGAYTEINNAEDGYFANEMIEGDEVTLEYYEPAGISQSPKIQVDGIAYVYRDVQFYFSKSTKDFGDSQYCEVNVNCTPEGANWQDEKRGVVRISLVIGSWGYMCSGSLINNVKQDCTPYLLTADHCGEGASTSNFNQWVFYFNYEAPGCSNPVNQPNLYTLNGCTKKANGGNGGDTGSDFLLLELNNSIPSNYNAYFNGWDRRNITSANGVSIHHPSGDIKKISTYTSNLISDQWGTASGSHWQVLWAATTNGHGVTEGGSSGSPIFNAEGRIVGDLTGGGSYCTQTNWPDFYGKLSYSWVSNGSSAAQHLKEWLDPDDTGIETLNGKETDCGDDPPIANFVASDTVITLGTTVHFTDLSVENPHHWFWNFELATVDTSIQQNPYSISFNSVGSFDVTLVVWNDYGYDTLLLTDYITVIPVPADLDIIDHSISQTSVVEGDSIMVGASVKNIGQSLANASNLKFYLSPNISYNLSDLLLDSIPLSQLINQQDTTVSKYIHIPVGIASGNQFIIYFADADNEVSEGDETNNTAYKVLHIYQALPDFVVQDIVVDSTEIHPGSSTSAKCNVKNLGYADGAIGDLKVFLSNNLIFDVGTDPLLLNQNFAALAISATDSLALNIQVPANTGYGDYFLLFVADPDNQLVEISESNNIAYKQVHVTYPLNSEILDIENDIAIIPNPNSGEFLLSLPETLQGEFSIELLNVIGKTVLVQNYPTSENNINFDLKYLPKGVYFIKLRMADQIITRSFIKE